MAEHKLTPELMEYLKGMLPFSAETDEFVPSIFMRDNIPVEVRPVFKVRILKKTEHDRFIKLSNDIEKETTEAISEAARSVCVGWRNLFDVSTGNEIAFKGDMTGAAVDAWDNIPHHLRGRILSHAITVSGLLSADKCGLKS